MAVFTHLHSLQIEMQQEEKKFFILGKNVLFNATEF